MDREYFTRQDFYYIVWTIPVSQLLGKYHISHHKFQQLCKKSNIPLPGIGYWMKIKNNNVTQRKPLPVDNGSQELITLALGPKIIPRK